MMKQNRLKISSLVLLGSIIISGCSVPKKELNTYLNSYSSVKNTAEDLYIRSSIIAEKIANTPDASGTVSDKVKKLQERKSALDARLEAIRIIDEYNNILTNLASGTDPKQLKSDLVSLQSNLSSFNLAGIASIVSKTSPYLGIVADGISLIDGAIKKGKFKQAVIDAQRPLSSIIDILIDDADSIDDIFTQEYKSEQDQYRTRIDSTVSLFYSKLKNLKMSDKVQSRLERVNNIHQLMHKQPLQYKPIKSPSTPTTNDIESLSMMAEQIELNAGFYIKLEERITGQKSIIEEYKSALQSTKKAFVALGAGVQAYQYSSVVEFAKQAYALRKAVLQLQEVR